ncbi:MAG: YihY/virulence factor BrkB family protein [Haliscomenobacter sp.]|nr:YihY/virulence factor BrkB family protein [Haliscomenobacter sp.]
MKRLFQLWQTWETRFYESKPAQMVLWWAKTHSFPGFFKIPVYDVAVGLQKELQKYDLFIRANAVAYSFFLALFPSLIALFTLIPILKKTILYYLPEGAQFDMHLQAELQRLMPGVAGQRLFDFIEDITNNPRVALLSFGFLMAIYFASNGMLALMQGFDKSYPLTFVKRSPYAKRGIAILLTFILGLLLIASVVLIILGDFLIGFFSDLVGLDVLSALLLSGLRWVIIFALFYFSIGIIYRMGVATRKKFKLFTPGATVATVLGIISSLVFSAYVNNFNTYNELYGSIGTIIILMLWIQINAFSLLVGFELNASIAVSRDERQHIFESASKT